MKLYLTKNAGREEFTNVYKSLRSSYPEKVRREIYPDDKPQHCSVDP